MLVFSVQNMETARFAFLVWSMTVPLAFASVVIYVLGAMSGGLLWSLIKKMTTEEPKAHSPSRK